MKPNRKGIIAHTAVSTGALIPIGCVLERSKDKTDQCMKRLLDFHFNKNGVTNLQSVSVHSDRGYMTPKTVFEYLLASGADVVGTVKRMLKCWPYTFLQTLKENDLRTLIDTKGSPTLYIKVCPDAGKPIYASAFRNGTQAVATAVSSLHRGHQWEGIALNNNDRLKYQDDPTSLRASFFKRVKIDECEDQDASGEEIELMEDLFDEIEPYTIEQGKHFIYSHDLF